MRALKLITPSKDDKAMLAAAADGDKAAQAWLVRTFTPDAYRLAYRFLGNEQDARDASQDAMIKVLNHLHRYDRSRPFRSWLLGITRNTCIDALRRTRRRSESQEVVSVDPGPSPLELMGRAQRASQLRDAMEHLPPMYREVLVLYHFEHMKYAEIADCLDLPMGTVMNRIFRARKRLRMLLEDEGGTP